MKAVGKKSCFRSMMFVVALLGGGLLVLGSSSSSGPQPANSPRPTYQNQGPNGAAGTPGAGQYDNNNTQGGNGPGQAPGPGWQEQNGGGQYGTEPPDSKTSLPNPQSGPGDTEEEGEEENSPGGVRVPPPAPASDEGGPDTAI